MFGREVLRADESDLAERMPVWLFAVAAAAGASAVAYGILRLVRGRMEDGEHSELDTLEESAVERLRRDSVTGRSAIDVSALASGIIELTGMVPTHEVGQRAARLLHALPGVHTVINRLDTGSLGERTTAARSPLDDTGTDNEEFPSINAEADAAHDESRATHPLE